MIALVVGLLFATEPLAYRPQPIALDAVKRYASTCAGKQSADCQVLRREAEAVLIYDFMILERAGRKLDPAMLRKVASNAVTPGLRVEALERLISSGLPQEDESLVVAALKSPFPVERRVAIRALGQLSSEKYSRMLVRTYRGRTSAFPAARDYSEDEVPPGLTPYPGSETVWFASGLDRTWFASTDAPAKVAAAYAKNGKKAVTSTELEQGVKAATNIDPMEMMRLAQQDPRKMQEMMEKVTAAGNTRVDTRTGLWTAIEGEEGVSDVRYVVLEDQPFLMGRVPTKVVAIFKDEVLGKTSIVFATPPPSLELPDASSPEFMSTMKLWQIVNRPLEPDEK
jgi:hypothetical protein